MGKPGKTTGSRALGIALIAGLSGCNHYEIFRVAGFAQESFSNDADILFVIDNSSSMTDESLALSNNFSTFIRRLSDPSEGGLGTEGLKDATDAYIQYVRARDKVINYQLAITTTDVAAAYGGLYGPDPIIERGTDDVDVAFNRNLLCDAVCIGKTADVPSDPEYECDATVPTPDQVSQQYLDCLCGGQTWVDHCGSGTEEHLEAVFMAMCRSVEAPPEACFDTINQFTEADILSNEGLLRENSTLIPVIVTDEGDGSRRMTQGDDEPNEYAELFAQFDTRMSFAVIGPTVDNCNTGGAPSWGIERFQYMVDETGGRYFQIADKDGNGDCVVTDFEVVLDQLGQLLNALADQFPLQSIPDVDTIRVFVEGKPVVKATEEIDADRGTVVYGDGWSYYAAANSIEFHGGAIPDYGADVRIYYKPLAGMPRTLPF